jgi:hypothetical protein
MYSIHRELLRHITSAEDEVEFGRDLLCKVSIHKDEMEITQLLDVLSVRPYARTR